MRKNVKGTGALSTNSPTLIARVVFKGRTIKKFLRPRRSGLISLISAPHPAPTRPRFACFSCLAEATRGTREREREREKSTRGTSPDNFPLSRRRQFKLSAGSHRTARGIKLVFSRPSSIARRAIRFGGENFHGNSNFKSRDSNASESL